LTKSRNGNTKTGTLRSFFRSCSPIAESRSITQFLCPKLIENPNSLAWGATEMAETQWQAIRSFASRQRYCDPSW
jgi:hypothetical protein